MKTWRIRFIIFLALCIVLELCLRFAGHKAGVSNNKMYPVAEVIYEPLFQADDSGITSFVKDSPILPIGYEINDQGFRSDLNFDKKTIDSLKITKNQQVVFLVGDSYTEGCCAFPIKHSFSNKLVEQEQEILLNFGVGATGLMQYKLIVDKYVPDLHPDLVIVAFYLGNDIMYHKRPTVPNIPLVYPIKNYNWLNAYGPPYYMENQSKNHLASPEEAYTFYIDNYTLWSKKATTFEKILRKSVLCSKVYLGIKEYYHKARWGLQKNIKDDDDVKITNALLREMKATCSLHDINMVVIGIPSPKDVASQVNLEEKYGKYFSDVSTIFPDISRFSMEDYDGLETGNHFNNLGHQKFYEFMRETLQNSKQQ